MPDFSTFQGVLDWLTSQGIPTDGLTEAQLPALQAMCQKLWDAQQAQRRGLTRAIGSQQRENFSGLEIERRVFHRDAVAEAAGEMDG